MKGRASTPIVAAISNAIGVSRTATALLLISSVSTIATKYMTESVTAGPNRPKAPVTPLRDEMGRACRFHRLAERQHAEDDEEQRPLNRFVSLLDIETLRDDDENRGDQSEDVLIEKTLNAASNITAQIAPIASGALCRRKARCFGSVRFRKSRSCISR